MNSVLDSIGTSISLPGGSVVVSHRAFVALDPMPGAVVLREPNVTPNVLTQISISDALAERTVLLLWRRQSVARGMALLYDPITQTLFVGAETYATAVDLKADDVIASHAVTLFWSFQRVGEFVLELGELECFLRAGTGEILDRASVDPPYELLETSEGVRFESPTHSVQWLRFPRPAVELP